MKNNYKTPQLVLVEYVNDVVRTSQTIKEEDYQPDFFVTNG